MHTLPFCIFVRFYDHHRTAVMETPHFNRLCHLGLSLLKEITAHKEKDKACKRPVHARASQAAGDIRQRLVGPWFPPKRDSGWGGSSCRLPSRRPKHGDTPYQPTPHLPLLQHLHFRKELSLLGKPRRQAEHGNTGTQPTCLQQLLQVSPAPRCLKPDQGKQGYVSLPA